MYIQGGPEIGTIFVRFNFAINRAVYKFIYLLIYLQSSCRGGVGLSQTEVYSVNCHQTIVNVHDPFEWCPLWLSGGVLLLSTRHTHWIPLVIQSQSVSASSLSNSFMPLTLGDALPHSTNDRQCLKEVIRLHQDGRLWFIRLVNAAVADDHVTSNSYGTLQRLIKTTKRVCLSTKLS